MAHASNWNPERYVKFAFERKGLFPLVRFYPYSMYAVRTAGGHTRWAKGFYNEELGYHIKYRGEYQRAMLAKNVIGTHGRWKLWKVWLLMRSADIIDLAVWIRAVVGKLTRRA
ncbi:MAG TPA: hypothetical protein VMO47_10580 [Rhodothermales bacterium]|nr:hypothetical protein [Rhodothermales bacterium]